MRAVSDGRIVFRLCLDSLLPEDLIKHECRSGKRVVMNEIDVVIKKTACVRNVKVGCASTIEVRAWTVNASIIDHAIGHIVS